MNPEEYANPEDYAVVIGIDRYAGLPHLKAASRDAARFTEWLLRPDGGGLPEKNVHFIPSILVPGDPFQSKPVLQDIEAALWRIGLLQYRRVGRRLYFYFAGHGVGPAFNEVAMLLATAGLGGLANVGLTHVQDFFHRAAVFDEIVYILDCCREERVAVCTGLTFNPVPRAGIPPTNDFVLLASVYRGMAYEPFDETNAARRGLMTEALLEGLNGAAGAIDTQGRITSDTVSAYVQRRVRELATQAEVDQQADPPKPASPPIVFRAAQGSFGEFLMRVTRGEMAQAYLLVVLSDGQEVGSSPPGVEIFEQRFPLNGAYQIVVEGGGLVAAVAPAMVKDGVVNVVFP